MIDLTGKTALITGAAGDIGLETVRVFAKLGARVILADLNGDGAERIAAEIRAGGAEATAVAVDISDEASVEAMAAAVRARYGIVDILVNNAAATGAVGKDLDVLGTDLAVWDLAHNVNLRGAMLMSRAILPLMFEAGGGAIVNIASRKGIRPERGAFLAYSVSKAGLIMLSQHMAASYGKRNIRSNVVAPGGVKPGNARPPKVLTEEQQAQARDRHTRRVGKVLLNDLGTVEDMANAIAFIASDSARYITGQVLGVDGGVLAYLDA